MYQRFTHPEEEEIPQLVETPSKKESLLPLKISK